MTPPPPLSVIVVSRHRPAALRLCLAALEQSDHPSMEVIVVADPGAVAGLHATRWSDRIKLAEFDEANIAAARNIGIALAAAPVIAFVDDDAVAEPTWASRIAAPFEDSRVAAAGGFVRGRNGISRQWGALMVDCRGEDGALVVDETRTTLHPGSGAQAVKTQGTNCAFRRDVLAAAGGFDPAFRFFLDDADVNLRLGAAGFLSAVVPLAEVQHGFAASARRRADRVPTSLRDIGASTAVFLRRHAPPGDHAAVLDRMITAQRRRLVAHMVAGRLLPGDVAPLMRDLMSGIAEGLARPLQDLVPLEPVPVPFRPLDGTGPRAHRILVSKPGRTAAVEVAASAARSAGDVVTILNLRPGMARHAMRFRSDAIWEQRGGLWGQSCRDDPKLRFWTIDERARRETARFAPVRTPR